MQGVRVLDLTRVLAGPFATQQLADQGADVIKVEAPGGDETRAFGPSVHGQSTYFQALNRNKRSIVLDLATAAGREVALALADRADVLVENFRPGVAARLGLGWEALRARNPRLVVVAIHAFGDEAPPEVTGRAGYDVILQAMGGAMAITGDADGPPYRSGTAIADLVAAMLATQAVLHGLLHRERTGQGQRIVVNMMQAQAACLSYHATRWTIAGQAEVRRGNAHAGMVPYGTWRCADGWIAIGCGNDAIWARLRHALGVGDDPAWRRNAGRVADRAAVDAAIARVVGAMAVARVDALLAEAGVPTGPVLRPEETLAHPAVSMVRLDHPVLGAFEAPGPALRTATTRTEHAAPPLLDADRDGILAELGYGEAERTALAEAGAFGTP